jgi:hypothetical protein
MRPLAKSALLGTTISLSLTLALLSMTASDRSLNLDDDSWIPTGLGGKRYASRVYRHFCLGKRAIARFGDDWERNLLLLRFAFPVAGA